MNMLFVIKYRLDRGAEKEIELPKGKSITLGGGAGCDVNLTPYFQMPDVCARIWHDDHCLVENLTRRTSIMLLNGHPLHSVALFENSDVLEIGVDQFRMTCRDDEAKASPPKSPLPAPDPAVPQISCELRSTVVSPSVTRHSPVDPNWRLAEMLKQLFEVHPTILFADFRAAGIDPPAESVAGADLFREAPDEIREEHSLHAIIHGSPDERLEWAQVLGEKDAGIVAIPEGEIARCLAEVRPLSGWLVRPSSLEVTLNAGSRILCDRLLAPFLGLVIHPRETGPEWVLYSSPGVSREKLLQAGFSVAAGNERNSSESTQPNSGNAEDSRTGRRK